MSQSVRVRFWISLYRLALALYPSSFRTRFRRQMLEDARRMLASSRPGRGAAVIRLFRDVARSLPAEWARELGRGGSTGGAGGGLSSVQGPRSGLQSGIVEDLRWAIRSLARAPRFTAAIILVLALGLAGATAVFSVVNAYLFRGLPYPHSERLVAVRPVPPVNWREARDIFDPPITWDLDAFTLVDGDRPELVEGAWVAPGFFEAFGIQPALGRGFDQAEATPGGASVAVISHALWQQRYGGDPGILGQAVSVYASDRPDDAEVFEIVGVLPEDFWFHNRYTGFLVPLRADNPVYMGRLREGLSIERAEEVLTSRAREASTDLPEDFRVNLTFLHERYVARVRPILETVALGVGLVLLLTCVNSALLLLVRTAGRGQELAIRRALGAGRGRVARQLFLEGLLLGGGAALLGLLSAAGAIGVAAEPLQSYLGASAPGGAAAMEVGGSTILFALLMALGVALIFGMVSVVAPVQRSLSRALGESGRGKGEARGPRRLRLVLVAGELGLSLALLIGAGLSIRSARNLATLDLGFESRDRVSAQVNLRQRSYPEAAQRLEFFRRSLAAAEELPGVMRAGGVIRPPFLWNFGAGGPLESEEYPQPDPERAPRAVGLLVTPGYFETMGIPLLGGRVFTPDDSEGKTPVTVVSASLARGLWPGEDPLGKRLREVLTSQDRAGGQEDPGEWWTVVGVVADIRTSLDGPGAQFYVPYGQLTPTTLSVILQLRPGAPAPYDALKAAVQEIDPGVALDREASLDAAVRQARAPASFLAAVLFGFAGFAAMLAVVGLFGTISYAASRARREVAVRIALGASRGHVVGLFLRTGAVSLAAGLPLGLAGGWLLARSLSDQLHGVAAWDPLTYLVLTALLGSSAFFASWLPALQAARSEPMAVLRDE